MSEKDMRMSELMDRQRQLNEKHRDEWAPLEPENGRNSLLWLVEELGETVSVVKKRGEDAILHDPAVRAHFLEEMSDILMFWADTLLCFGVTPEEISAACGKKQLRNLKRDWAAEEAARFTDMPE